MGETIRILVVEDDPLSAGLIKGWLTREKAFPFEMDWCTSLEEGLVRLREKEFDAALLDLSLPDSPTENTINQIAFMTRSSPVIVISADDDFQMTRRALDQGALDYLLKGHMSGTILSRSILLAMERRRAGTKDDRQALRDPLTGLYTRSFFEDYSEKRMDYARRNRASLGFLLLDVIDMSQSVKSEDIPSDSILLTSVAKVLHSNFRASDLLARYGGSRFAILAPDMDFEGMRIVEKRLQTMLYGLHLRGFLGFDIFDSARPKPLAKLLEGAEAMMMKEKARDQRQRRPPETVSQPVSFPEDSEDGGIYE